MFTCATFPFFFVLAYRKVLVVCEETHQLVSSLLDMSARETAMMAVEWYVDLHWVEFPMKCIKIHVLAHFTVHSCNSGKMFPSLDGLQKHFVRWGLFTGLYGQVD